MNKTVAVWEEELTIPTYEVGEPEKYPAFAEAYSYHGRKGRVYPYPLLDVISDTRVDRVYQALCLENEYIKLVIIPQLGGRIIRAWDKMNDHDFVYANHVIKPALVGENGAWMMGGIECFPRRSCAFAPVNARMEQAEDGSCSVCMQRTDRISGVRQMVKLTLLPGQAYVQITEQLFNPTAMKQYTYSGISLMVAVNETSQVIFPPDTLFSKRKMIPRPSGCQVERSRYDFIGNYDYEMGSGVVYVSDHHSEPEKRRFTYGNGACGQAWEHALTDADGPFAELSCGTFVDGYPMPVELAPFEQKRTVRYVIPYTGVGAVKNATHEILVGMELSDSELTVRVFSTETRRVRIVLTEGFDTLLEADVTLDPTESYERVLDATVVNEAMLRLAVYDAQTHALLISYRPQAEIIGERRSLQDAKLTVAQPLPRDVDTNDRLYLLARQIERKQMADCLQENYYLEGLRRDPADIRINRAYGELLLERGDFEDARKHFVQALHCVEGCDTEEEGRVCLRYGLCEWYCGDRTGAYDLFCRALRANDSKEAAEFYLAAMAAGAGRWQEALDHIEASLERNVHHVSARAMKGYILRHLGQFTTALRCLRKNLELDPFDFVSANEIRMLGKGKEEDCMARLGDDSHNFLLAAREYLMFGAYEEAAQLLARCPKKTFLVDCYRAYVLAAQKHTPEAEQLLLQSEECAAESCYPNCLEDITVLDYAIRQADSVEARYELGCLYYDKKQYAKAIHLWEEAAVKQPKQVRLHRNLALAYANVDKDFDNARREMEKAFYLNERDATVFWELDQLDKQLGMSFEKRLERYEKYISLVELRDDMYVEYITLLNMTGQYEKAHNLTMQHQFHVWERCEGAVGGQYVRSLLEMANRALMQGDALQAERYLRHALVWPTNLGEGRSEHMADNDICYHLGLALELQEKHEEAELFYKKATLGGRTLEGISYRDDLAGERLLYQGFALLKMGEDEEGYRCFDRLIAYGEEHLEDEPGCEFLPEAYQQPVSFVQNHALRNRAHCHYFIGLGYLGYGDMEFSNEQFRKVVECEPANIRCRLFADV